MSEKNKTSNKKNIDIDSLKKIAIFLEGFKQGRGGNLLPLGTNDLEQLWCAISLLQGNSSSWSVKTGNTLDHE